VLFREFLPIKHLKSTIMSKLGEIKGRNSLIVEVGTVVSRKTGRIEARILSTQPVRPKIH